MLWAWIHNLPEPVFGFLCCAVFVLLGIAGYFVFGPVVRYLLPAASKYSRGVVVTISAVTTLYGLVLALIAVASWQQFVEARNTVAQEASALRSVYHDVSSFPEPDRTILTDQLRAYTRNVIDYEWPQQQRGVVPVGGTDMITMFENSLYAFEPRSERARLIDQSAIAEFNRMLELRVLRLNTITAGIPDVLWATLLIGAMITTVLTYCLQLKPLRVQLVITSFFTLLVGLVVFMTAVVDHPFRGAHTSVTPEVFELVYQRNMLPEPR